MGFQKGNNYGTKSKRGKSKINQELKDKLADLSREVLDSIDVNSLSNSDRLKLLSISTSYVLPKLKSIATNIEPDAPSDYQIHIIDDKGEIDKIVKLLGSEADKNGLGAYYDSQAFLWNSEYRELNEWLTFDVIVKSMKLFIKSTMV